MDKREMKSVKSKLFRLFGISSIVVTFIWVILIVMSNISDGPIQHPAPAELLTLPFNAEKSLKFCVFSQDQGEPELGAVVIKNNVEYILPLQKSVLALKGNRSTLFENSLALISDMEESKSLTRELLRYERNRGYPTDLLHESEIELLPFIERPAKMLHGTNSPAHHRNVKRTVVKKWFPVISKILLNPYNMITKDSFYGETNEEPEFGFFHGNNIGIYKTGDQVLLPKSCNEIDFETELALVIGKTGTTIPNSEAKPYVAGYLMFNDFSDRVIQDKERLTFIGYQKSKYISALSSYLVTDIEPEKFTIRALVNGKEVLTACADEIFNFLSLEEQVSHYSNYGTLVPGTVIATGTMAGGCLVELELPFLTPGDKVEFIGNQGLGSLSNVLIK